MIKIKNKNIQVIKSNGDIVDFDDEKIKKQVKFAIKNTSLEFEDVWKKVKFEIRKEKIKTSEIQERLIKALSKYISKESPEYNIVVGRLYSWHLYRLTYKNTKFDISEWKNHILFLVDNRFYKLEIKEFLEKLDKESLKLISKYIDYDNNMDFSKVYIQSIILDKKNYLVKRNKRLIEYPILADIADALILSEGDNSLFRKYFKLLHFDYISLATPFRKNLRRYKGNLGSCFIGEGDDNLVSLTKSYADISFISKYGGGIGWYLSKIRPEGTFSNNVLKSVKINKWAKILNDIIVATTQGGGSRKGALTIALDWWHLNIEDFLTIKSELDGDLRDKCFDIFPQIVVDNWFINKVKNKEEVALFDHYTYNKKYNVDITELTGEELHTHFEKALELVKTNKLKGKILKANDLWKKILWTWIEIGDMYIFNRDNGNISNYLKDFGITKCGNLCQESYSLTKVSTKWEEIGEDGKRDILKTDGIYHSCNLISINLANIIDKSKEELIDIAKLTVNALDLSIDLSNYPVLEAKRGSTLLRNIGIGFVGIADYLAYNNLVLNDQGIKKAEQIIEFFTYYCYKASIELATEKGSYPLYDKANYDTLLGKDPKELNKLSLNNFDWVQLQKEIKEKGIRNFYLMAIAPNTTTAGLCNASASYLPVYGKEMYQTFAEFSVPVIPKYIKEKYWYYKTKWQYPPEEIIKYTRHIQRWIDTGVSMEININPELTNAKKISDAIIEGFLSKEIKAVYYSLTIDNKDSSSGCTDCAN